MNLFSFLFPVENDLVTKEIVYNYKPIAFTSDLKKEVLFESYISIDAIVFYMGAYHTNSTTVTKIVSHVLEAKDLIVKDKGIIEDFNNLSEEVPKSKARDLIKFRNKLIKNDKSGIFKNLILKKQMHLKTTEVGEDPGRNEMYVEMIQRLKNSISNGENVTKKINEEKINFYKDYAVVTSQERQKILMDLSLGGFILRLPSLFTFIQKIEIPKKSVTVKKWIMEFFKIIEDLELRTKTKELIEQKSIIREFLIGCLYRKNHAYDKIFEMRSEIMDLVLTNFNDYVEENIKQEEEIRRMIQVVDNIATGKITVVYSKDIREKFIVYLLTGLDSDKEVLLEEFKQYLKK